MVMNIKQKLKLNPLIQNQYIIEELDTLKVNIQRVAVLIKSKKLSTYGYGIAEKILEMLLRVKEVLKDEKSSIGKVNLLIERLPLLYLQINKIT